MSVDEEKAPLTDSVKASVMGSGVLDKLKTVAQGSVPPSRDENQQALQQQARAAIADIQELLSASRNDRASAKLTGLLAKLQNALEKGTLSGSSITAALSEAVSATNSASENVPAHHLTPQQQKEKLWLQVEADNKEINDDFTKMQKAGVHFNDGLWERHKQLTEELAAHPRDIKKQKELDAVDDAMLMQAEKQLDTHPDAKAFFDDAKKRSIERHQLVDKDLEAINNNKRLSTANAVDAAFNEDAHLSPKPQGGQLTIDDIKPPEQTPEPDAKKFVRMQKNVQFRTKSHQTPALFFFTPTHNRLNSTFFHNSSYPGFRGSDGKSCSKVNVGLLHNRFCLTQRAIQPLRKTKDEKSNHVLPGIHRQTGRKRFGNRRTDQGGQGFRCCQ